MAGIKFPSKPPRGKPGKQLGTRPLLPNRAALHRLTRGPGMGVGRELSGAGTADYAAATPSGLAGMGQSYQSLTDMGVPPDDTGSSGTDTSGG